MAQAESYLAGGVGFREQIAPYREEEPPSFCDASDGLETLRVYAAISKAISPWLAPLGRSGRPPVGNQVGV